MTHRQRVKTIGLIRSECSVRILVFLFIYQNGVWHQVKIQKPARVGGDTQVCYSPGAPPIPGTDLETEHGMEAGNLPIEPILLILGHSHIETN